MKRNALVFAVLVASAVGGLTSSRLVAQGITGVGGGPCSYPVTFSCPLNSSNCPNNPYCRTDPINAGDWIVCLMNTQAYCMSDFSPSFFCDGHDGNNLPCACFLPGACPPR